MIIHREIANLVKERSLQYPVVSLTGPRQSGKTTLTRSLFPDYTYVSLERPDIRAFAEEDPIRFLKTSGQGMILDEVQRVPDLFSYIQVIVDENRESGQFVLTGSQNFLLLERITQSLAGRVSLFKLLPFSLPELQKSPYDPTNLDSLLFTGSYPPVYDRGYDPHAWYMDYIQTYIERDVRSVRNVTDLNLFQTFLGLCAGRTGQLLNLNSLANDCGISHNTARDWLSVLEASFLVFRLPPYHENFNKRITKQPKLFFYDTGLLCALLGLRCPQDLAQHYLRGSVFESFIISELVKQRWLAGQNGTGFFWRDRHGHEIDYLLETPRGVVPLEIKSAETVRSSMFDGLTYWSKLTGSEQGECFLVYGGEANQSRRQGHVLGWRALPNLELILNS